MRRHTPGKWYASTTGDQKGLIAAVYDKRNAALIAAAPELVEKLRESIDLLIGAAAWLKSSGQPMVAQGLRKWVAEHGQPALDRAEGVQDA